MMISPEDRLELLERTWRLVRERKVFLADFWNSGTGSNGCIAAGHSDSGYLYINWNGDVTPCVFIPYKLHNIYDVYKSGGNLDTILNSPLFKAIREWQIDYSFMKNSGEMGNQIMPCIIRDHHKEFMEIVRKTGAQPIDELARAALEDDEYHQGLIEFDKEFAKLTEPIWEQCYLRSFMKEEKAG